MNDLNVELRDKIDAKFIESKKNLDAGEIEQGVRLAEEAWSMFPDPKFDWDVSKSFAHALAETYRDVGRYDDALKTMDDLFASGTVLPHQSGPYFIMGSIYFESGDMENAKKWLQEADQISKGRCFRGQPEKYQIFLKSKK